MSEIYKRSLGYPVDERRLALELGNGTAGYDTTQEEIIVDELSIRGSADETTYLLAFAEQEVDRIELTYEYVKAQFEEITAKEPVAQYIEIFLTQLTADYDRRKSEGQPVGSEFYVEAFDMAEEIVAANPDFDHEECKKAARALIELQRAERELADAERELMALAA